MVAYPVKWNPGPNPPENFDVPLREVLNMPGGPRPKTTRYVTYEVNVSLDGKSRRYRAFALFNEGFETSDTPKILFFDHISGGGFNMPARLLYENRAPVKSNPAPKGVKKDAILGLNAARGGEDDSPLVCSFETRKCCWKPGFRYAGYDYPSCEPGRSGNDEEGTGASSSLRSNSAIATAIAAAATCETPGEPASCRFFRSQKQSEKTGSDTNVHLWGAHWAKFKSTGFCQVTPNCSAECGHDPPVIEHGDHGMGLTCHIGFDDKSQAPSNSTYNPANPPKCSEHMSVTYWACTACICLDPGIDIIWEVRQIWTLSFDPVYTCGET